MFGHDYGTTCTICGASLNTEHELERRRCDEHRYHRQWLADLRHEWCKFWDVTGSMMWEWVYGDNPFNAHTHWIDNAAWCAAMEQRRWVRYRLYRVHLWLTEHLTPSDY